MARYRSGMDRSRHRVRDGSRRYGREETADILDLASALEPDEGILEPELTERDLYRIADELGISPRSVDAAIADRRRAGRDAARASRRSVQRRMRFIRHAIAYIVIVGTLAVIDALGGGGWWFFYVAGLWGIVLALHGMRFVTRRNGPLERRLLARASIEPK